MDKWDNKLSRLLISLIILVSFTSGANADFTGEVVGIIDGDIIEVLHDGKSERVRLHGIDAPEKKPVDLRPPVPPRPGPALAVAMRRPRPVRPRDLPVSPNREVAPPWSLRCERRADELYSNVAVIPVERLHNRAKNPQILDGLRH